MKVVAICGSHRKGNTEWMLKKLLERVEENGAEVELILLRKANVKMCLGCLSCEEGGKDRKGICKIKDDMNALYPKLLSADCLVLGTPAYFELVFGNPEKIYGQDLRDLAGIGRKTPGRCRRGRRRHRTSHSKFQNICCIVQNAVGRLSNRPG